jgi:hypothetical protein
VLTQSRFDKRNVAPRILVGQLNGSSERIDDIPFVAGVLGVLRRGLEWNAKHIIYSIINISIPTGRTRFKEIFCNKPSSYYQLFTCKKKNTIFDDYSDNYSGSERDMRVTRDKSLKTIS